MRLTDSTGRVLKIEMQSRGVDCTYDFFAGGTLEYSPSRSACIVGDIDVCLQQAFEWAEGIGDFADGFDTYGRRRVKYYFEHGDSLAPYYVKTNADALMAFVGIDNRCIIIDSCVMAKNVREFKGDIRDAVEILDQMTADGVLPVDYDDDLGCWGKDDHGNNTVYRLAELLGGGHSDYIELTPDVVATVHILEKEGYGDDGNGGSCPIGIDTVRDTVYRISQE